MALTSPFTAGETSASGQVFEFRLWAALTEQSRGALHVFLPLSDRGIDALIHRRTDDAYIEVQAKGRSSLLDGQVHIAVWAESLRNDNAILVGGLITEGGLGPMMLVISEGDFKRLAYFTSDAGKPLYSAEFGMRPREDSRWLPFLIPVEDLAQRFGVSPEAELAERRRPEWRSAVGFLGEAEVTRLLAESDSLNLFRPFPDMETSELAVLDLDSHRVLGIQIKTVNVEKPRMRATVNIHASSFRASPVTYFVVLAYQRDERRFDDDALLVPTLELANLARDDHKGHLQFHFHPGTPSKYRVERVELCAHIKALVS